MITESPIAASQFVTGADGDVVLEVRHLTKRFPIGTVLNTKNVHALTDASFQIRRGEVVSLVGESGSGKSTFVREHQKKFGHIVIARDMKLVIMEPFFPKII